jgi:hypothetical protein
MNLHKLILTNNNCYKAGKKIAVKGIMVHSTGANNPNLKRYLWPDDGLLGKNQYGNHWNTATPGGRQVCVHAFIGLLGDGKTVATYQTLPWDMRGWHSASGAKGAAHDTHIGFEICEDGLSDPVYFGKVYQEAVELCAYLCDIYGLNPLADGVIIGHYEGHARGIASNHGDPKNWFPKHGKSMDTFRAAVAAEIKKSGGTSAPAPAPSTPAAPSGSNEAAIWSFLKGKGLNDCAVAGIMGNLYAESGLVPTNLQNTYEKKLGLSDSAYTTAVDKGTYNNFVRDSAGYGLAQWTYWSRKEAFLAFAKAAGASIGDLGMQLDFLWKELQGYTAVLKVLRDAKTVAEASNVFLLQYEKPADQSAAAQSKRAGFGQKYFDKYAGKTVTPPTSVPYTVRVPKGTTYRKGAGAGFAVAGTIEAGGVFTIIEEKDGWGKLKSGAGWIFLSSATKI